jgi:hypothetical protein
VAKILYALVIVLCLLPGILMSVTSQQINFNSEYVTSPPAEVPHFSTTAIMGDYIDVDDALRALLTPSFISGKTK